MPGKMSDPGTMLEKIMKSKGDAGEGEEIRASSREGSGKYRKRLDPGKYRKGRIMASVKKVESGRVPEKGLGEYRKW